MPGALEASTTLVGSIWDTPGFVVAIPTCKDAPTGVLVAAFRDLDQT